MPRIITLTALILCLVAAPATAARHVTVNRYDARGNVVASENRLIVEVYRYDARGHLVACEERRVNVPNSVDSLLKWTFYRSHPDRADTLFAKFHGGARRLFNLPTTLAIIVVPFSDSVAIPTRIEWAFGQIKRPSADTPRPNTIPDASPVPTTWDLDSLERRDSFLDDVPRQDTVVITLKDGSITRVPVLPGMHLVAYDWWPFREHLVVTNASNAEQFRRKGLMRTFPIWWQTAFKVRKRFVASTELHRHDGRHEPITPLPSLICAQNPRICENY